MSVIGRLDDQVNAVLIAPLDKDARRKTEARREAQDEQATVSHHNHQTPDEALSSQNERAGKDELPIWLL